MKAVNSRKFFVLLALILALSLIVAGTALAAMPTESPVFWSWDFESGNTDNPVGTSQLVRTGNGLNASYQTDVLTPGNAVTLWFIVFNYPEYCAGGPYMCSPDDLGDTPAQGDFFLASGHVIGGDGKGNFGGHLKAGDSSRSGLAEMMGMAGCDDCTPGLIEPDSALVVLAAHDHGPALTGQALVEQISTFLGDCDAGFIGDPNTGFATGPGDLPIPEGGYCSTIQFSAHPPDGS